MTVFRSLTSKDELDSEEDKDKLNKWNGTYDEETNENSDLSNRKTLNDHDRIELENAKLKQSKINKCHKILREIAFNFMFIWVLLVVAYISRNSNGFNYQKRTSKTFNGYKNVNFYFLLFLTSSESNFLKLNYRPNTFTKADKNLKF